jgi:hypothetical protein
MKLERIKDNEFAKIILCVVLLWVLIYFLGFQLGSAYYHFTH